MVKNNKVVILSLPAGRRVRAYTVRYRAERLPAGRQEGSSFFRNSSISG